MLPPKTAVAKLWSVDHWWSGKSERLATDDLKGFTEKRTILITF